MYEIVANAILRIQEVRVISKHNILHSIYYFTSEGFNMVELKIISGIKSLNFTDFVELKIMPKLPLILSNSCRHEGDGAKKYHQHNKIIHTILLSR